MITGSKGDDKVYCSNVDDCTFTLGNDGSKGDGVYFKDGTSCTGNTLVLGNSDEVASFGYSNYNGSEIESNQHSFTADKPTIINNFKTQE